MFSPSIYIWAPSLYPHSQSMQLIVWLSRNLPNPEWCQLLQVYKYYMHPYRWRRTMWNSWLVWMIFFLSSSVCVCVCFKREKAKKCTVIRKWQTAEGRVSQSIREDKPQNANPTQLHPSTLANQYKGAEEKWEGQ